MSLEKSTKFKNIFFDFDGVLAESVNAKTEAFRELYLSYGKEIADKVVDHHINHGGVSRFEKFKIYHNQFLGVDLLQEGVNILAQKFSDLVLEKVINSEEVKGSVDFLNKYHKSVKFWVITGTPTDEMNIIAKARQIEDYFIGIYGSPKNKKYWTEFLIEKHDLKREEILFLGDATTDYEAAQFSKLHFALREHDENKSIFKDYKGLRFKDFLELNLAIENNLS
ncbi:HAD family hydrolase [Winogradskyella sp.]|uniref:HAD family hydrolase n=1 Tax=Winogradskyella sp. TaxID=1883156 RepID=UPI0035161237